ncbi:non-ribosomal peptide synthetase [Methylibium sp.]|uniref:non-ribosomal peptide synthetase n=1 Tax=Methylibium sp. TaxID=2067992 RepID=UPI003D0A6426
MVTVFEQFQRIARLHPDRFALISDVESLSYRQLAGRATRISSSIRHWSLDRLGRDLRATDVVGVSLPKCADLYAAILGILEAGGSYLPLDPELGPDIRRHIAERCRCVLSLVGESAQTEPDLDRSYSRLQVSAPDERLAVAGDRAPTIPTDLCYTIFTSGSTGAPKGVAVQHGSLMNLVSWTRAEFGMGVATRGLQYSTINFDASVLDIFPTLLSGGALCIPTAEQRLSATGLSDFCRRHRVNHAFLPPSLLTVLEPSAFESISVLLTGGEACSPEVVDRWSVGRRLFNLYGPTECTVLASFKPMQYGENPRNIGKAIPGVRLHVLDDSGEPAVRGELHIGGLAVAPGYVSDAVTTASRFVRLPCVDASVLYKTGDVVEVDQAGDLHFIGRRDRQVKLRGFRIELEEIEGALLALGCREAAVKVSAREALIAYVSADSPMSDAELKAALIERLGAFKVPQHVVRLPLLPIRSSGKIDYQSLPDPGAVEAPTAAPLPACPAYAALAELWAGELEFDSRTLSVTSNFRDLGGTSLNFVSLLSAIDSRFGVGIAFIDFFRNPTLEFLHQSLQQHQGKTCCLR